MNVQCSAMCWPRGYSTKKSLWFYIYKSGLLLYVGPYSACANIFYYGFIFESKASSKYPEAQSLGERAIRLSNDVNPSVSILS